MDVGFGVRIHTAEHLSLDAVGLGALGSVAVEAIRVVDPTRVLCSQDAAVAHEADGAARSERAAAEAEEVQLVPGFVGLDEEAIAVAHIAGEAKPERSATDTLETPRSHARLVMQELSGALAIFTCYGQSKLGHVRGGGDSGVELVGPIPGPIAGNDQALWHDIPPSRLGSDPSLIRAGETREAPRGLPPSRAGRRTAS